MQHADSDRGKRKKRDNDGGDVTSGLILTDEEKAELAALQPSIKSYSEFFRQQCPIYMSYGMTYQEFWHGPPEMATVYREAEAFKQEAQNRQAWLQGIYIYKAFSTVLENAFTKEGTPAKPYLLSPLDLKEPTRADEIIAVGKERAKMLANLQVLQANFGRGSE